VNIPLADLINAGTIHWRDDLPKQVDAIVDQTAIT
jgi:hypothetical protein